MGTEIPDWELSRDTLLERYTRYAHYIAARWKRLYGCLDYDDLYSEVMCGFIIAANRYDRSRQLAFGTSATAWARHRVQQLVKNELAHGFKTTTQTICRIPVYPIRSSTGSDYPEAVVDVPDRAGHTELHPSDLEYLYEHALSALPDKRSRNAVIMRLTQDHLFKDIGESLGVSRARADQIVRRALSYIREKRPEIAEQLT